jgi:hypothetical protein
MSCSVCGMLTLSLALPSPPISCSSDGALEIHVFFQCHLSDTFVSVSAQSATEESDSELAVSEVGGIECHVNIV